MIPYPLIHALPKTDLHCHLDGSVRLDTLWQLGKERKINLGARSLQELRRLISPQEATTLSSYIKRFEWTLAILQDADSLRRAAYELAEDASKENVRYLEVRYAPDLHTKDGLTLPKIVDAVIGGLRDAEQDFGILSGVIVCGIRTIDPELSLTLAELAVTYKNRGVVGFDLAGEERDYPAKNHLQAFYKILNNNVNLTVHAGEGFGPPSIHQALHYAGAHRIGHGTRLHEDPDLLQYANDHRIPLEMCLSSNLHTGAVASIHEHPFGEYYRKDLRVTINTDNRLISNTSASKELSLACEAFDLTIYDLRKILINGFKSSFLSQDRKKATLREAITEMDDLFDKYYPGDYDRYRTFL